MWFNCRLKLFKVVDEYLIRQLFNINSIEPN
jgi:hypothetical protein